MGGWVGYFVIIPKHPSALPNTSSTPQHPPALPSSASPIIHEPVPSLVPQSCGPQRKEEEAPRPPASWRQQLQRRRRPLALRGAWRGRRLLALRRGGGAGGGGGGDSVCLELPSQVPLAAQAYQALNPPPPQDLAESLPEGLAKPPPPPPMVALHEALPRQKESPLAGLHLELCQKVPTALEQIHPLMSLNQSGLV